MATATEVKPNKVRLRRIARLIQKFPQHFDMMSVMDGPSWTDHVNFDSGRSLKTASKKINLMKKCDGSTACIAGWGCALYPDEIRADDDWSDAAARILGLDDMEAHRLFNDFSLNTPEKAAEMLNRIADGERPYRSR